MVCRLVSRWSSSSKVKVTWSGLEGSLAMASSMHSILVLGGGASAMVGGFNESTNCYDPRVRGLGNLQKKRIEEKEC